MRLERLRRADLASAVDDLDFDRPDGSAAFVVQTVAETSYPTAPQSVYAARVLTVDGAEDEGASAYFATSSDPDVLVHAVNLGTQVPPEGTKLIVEAVGGRLAFRYDG